MQNNDTVAVEPASSDLKQHHRPPVEGTSQNTPRLSASEPYKLGKVTYAAHIHPEVLGIAACRTPRLIRQAQVTDPYVEVWDPADREYVALVETDADRHARERREAGLWQRAPGTAYFNDDTTAGDEPAGQWGDPVASARFFDGVDSPGMKAWKTLIPSARALLYLSDPWNHHTIDTAPGPVPTDSNAKRLLSLATDAIAIRSRASVMAQLIADLHLDSSNNSRNTTPLRWMSVACGTALPAMKAAVNATIRPELLLVDYDRSALDLTRKLAELIGFQGQIETKRINIFNYDAMTALGEHLADTGRSPQLIDLMGIFEYTGTNLGVDPIRFLESIWGTLAPGGSIILGQMLTTRPLPDFTMGAVQWPFIEMRTLDEMLAVTTAAGVPAERTEVYLPADGVYAVLHANKQHDDQPQPA
jgi:hypothetical protein